MSLLLLHIQTLTCFKNISVPSLHATWKLVFLEPINKVFAPLEATYVFLALNPSRNEGLMSMTNEPGIFFWHILKFLGVKRCFLDARFPAFYSLIINSFAKLGRTLQHEKQRNGENRVKKLKNWIIVLNIFEMSLISRTWLRLIFLLNKTRGFVSLYKV